MSLPTAVTAEHRDAVAISLVYQAGHVGHRLGFEFAADEDLHRDRRDIHTDGVFHAASDLLIGEFLENCWDRRWRA